MSTQISNNNKRISKNTLFLYFRMLFMMAVSLYTSRVILSTLGIEDFGINNVVGGFVAMFTFINTSMYSATERFLNYEMGCGDEKSLHTVFCTSVNIHILISLIIFVLAETVGLWFLCNKKSCSSLVSHLHKGMVELQEQESWTYFKFPSFLKRTRKIDKMVK